MKEIKSIEITLTSNSKYYGMIINLDGIEYDCYGSISNSKNSVKTKALFNILSIILNNVKVDSINIRSDDINIKGDIKGDADLMKLLCSNVTRDNLSVSIYGNRSVDLTAMNAYVNVKCATLSTSKTFIYEPKTLSKSIKTGLLNPQLTGNNWFFKTNTINSQQIYNDLNGHLYMTAKFEEDAKMNKFNPGKRTPDSHYSIFVSKEPINVLDDLGKYFNTEDINISDPVIIKLTNVTKKDVWDRLLGKNDYTHRVGSDLMSVTGNKLGSVIKPYKMMFRFIDNFNQGILVLVKYFNKDSVNIKTIDISDMFIDVDKNGKMKIAKDVTIKTKYIIVNYNGIDVKLTIGIDTAPRKSYTNCIKLKHKQITTKLIIWEETDNQYRCGTIIETNDGVSLHYSIDSNLRIKRINN